MAAGGEARFDLWLTQQSGISFGSGGQSSRAVYLTEENQMGWISVKGKRGLMAQSRRKRYLIQPWYTKNKNKKINWFVLFTVTVGTICQLLYRFVDFFCKCPGHRRVCRFVFKASRLRYLWTRACLCSHTTTSGILGLFLQPEVWHLRSKTSLKFNWGAANPKAWHSLPKRLFRVSCKSRR